MVHARREHRPARGDLVAHQFRADPLAQRRELHLGGNLAAAAAGPLRHHFAAFPTGGDPRRAQRREYVPARIPGIGVRAGGVVQGESLACRQGDLAERDPDIGPRSGQVRLAEGLGMDGVVRVHGNSLRRHDPEQVPAVGSVTALSARSVRAPAYDPHNNLRHPACPGAPVNAARSGHAASATIGKRRQLRREENP
jgi:hypothetical protein